MGLIEFNKLPVNTLVGADRKTFARLTQGREIDRGYRQKYHLTHAVSNILSLLRPIEDRRFRKLADRPIENAPLFILGHWRSGTTFVHNVLAADRQFGYNTTYQTVFPNLMFTGQSFFRHTMAWLMPDKRPTDSMELRVDLPQEEEFALANMSPYTFYNFWFFPRHTMEYAEKYLLFNTISDAELAHFRETFIRLIKTSLWNTGGTRFLSKNPPHTGRIRTLLEMFPDAKFLYLYRNPYTVFESTRSFFTNTIRPLRLQHAADEEMEQNIIEIYRRLFFKYEEEKSLIPPGNLIEVRFEDFEAAPLAWTERIYSNLALDGFAEARPAITAYLDGKKGYRKNAYKYEDRTVSIVENNWQMALDKWGYKI